MAFSLGNTTTEQAPLLYLYCCSQITSRHIYHKVCQVLTPETVVGLLLSYLSRELLPIAFYFAAYLIPRRKWLIAYAFFWLINLVSFVYFNDPVSGVNTLYKIRSIAALFIFLHSFGAASVGIIGKAFVFYSRSRGSEVDLKTIHIYGLLSILTIVPIFDLMFPYWLDFYRRYFIY